jgi:hypothetical protein
MALIRISSRNPLLEGDYGRINVVNLATTPALRPAVARRLASSGPAQTTATRN